MSSYNSYCLATRPSQFLPLQYWFRLLLGLSNHAKDEISCEIDHQYANLPLSLLCLSCPSAHLPPCLHSHSTPLQPSPRRFRNTIHPGRRPFLARLDQAQHAEFGQRTVEEHECLLTGFGFVGGFVVGGCGGGGGDDDDDGAERVP